MRLPRRIVRWTGRGFFPIYDGGELAVPYCFVFLYLAAAGGGAFSVDGMRPRRLILVPSPVDGEVKRPFGR